MPAGRSFVYDSHLQSRTGSVVVGDPTEGALIVAAQSRFNPASSGTGNAQAGYDSL